MSGYVEISDETKYMSFLIKNNKLLEKYNEICDKVSNIIKRKKDLIVNLYTIKPYEDKTNTIFYNDRIAK